MTVLMGAIAIALVTWLGAPTVGPIVVGIAIGVLWPARAARTAALAGMAGWGGLLLLGMLRGDNMGAIASSLGSAIGLPGWALFLATLLYPSLLAASAAWLAHLLTPQRDVVSNAGTSHS
jgi:hypothetical protein